MYDTERKRRGRGKKEREIRKRNNTEKKRNIYRENGPEKKKKKDLLNMADEKRTN